MTKKQEEICKFCRKIKGRNHQMYCSGYEKMADKTCQDPKCGHDEKRHLRKVGRILNYYLDGCLDCKCKKFQSESLVNVMKKNADKILEKNHSPQLANGDKPSDDNSNMGKHQEGNQNHSPQAFSKAIDKASLRGFQFKEGTSKSICKDCGFSEKECKSIYGTGENWHKKSQPIHSPQGSSKKVAFNRKSSGYRKTPSCASRDEGTSKSLCKTCGHEKVYHLHIDGDSWCRVCSCKKFSPEVTSLDKKSKGEDVGSELAKKIFRNSKIREEMMKWKKIDIIDYLIERDEEIKLCQKCKEKLK